MLRCSLPSWDQRAPHFVQNARETSLRTTTMRTESQTGHRDKGNLLESTIQCGIVTRTVAPSAVMFSTSVTTELPREIEQLQVSASLELRLGVRNAGHLVLSPEPGEDRRGGQCTAALPLR